MMGLFGTGISMLIFGFSRNIWVALVARALGGLLNGYGKVNHTREYRLILSSNIGVIQTTVAEVVKVKEHQREYMSVQYEPRLIVEARAYSIMPFVWTVGYVKNIRNTSNKLLTLVGQLLAPVLEVRLPILS